MQPNTTTYTALDQWIDQHFDEQVQFLQALVRIPTDTPPGNNTPHALLTAALLAHMGLTAEAHEVPAATVQAHGMQSITNLIVRRAYGASHSSKPPGHIDKKGLTIALNAHGDVVPPGDHWTHPPYGGMIDNGAIYGRATAVSKSDFATYAYALRALEAIAPPSQGSIELHLTYDEELGGELGPLWLLQNGLTQPDMVIAAGFSYAVITAHNGCLQMKVTVHGQMAHAAIPHTGVDALQATTHILNALYAHNIDCQNITSKVPGIDHPYLNVGRIEGGTHTNVVPGSVTFYLDRRMTPEENTEHVEQWIRGIIMQAVDSYNLDHPAAPAPITFTIDRLLLAQPMLAQTGNSTMNILVEALQRHGQTLFGCPIPSMGTPLYTDARHYAHHGIPAVLYGAGPRTVLESHAKRADEHLQLADLRRATQVVARTLLDLFYTSSDK
jgi:succinyl-diaminopimelate desuccinylase